MKLTRKNTKSLITIIVLSMIAGALTWALLAKFLHTFDVDITLSTGRIGFDIHVIALYLRVNPGTVLGIGTGFFIFSRL